MKPFLMGTEIEFAMRGRRGGHALSGEQVHGYLLAALKKTYRHLPDLGSERGVFLENSMRYYLDSGAHNELCTPELHTPREVAAYDKAGERMLLEAARAAMQRYSDLDLAVTKYNIDVHLPDEIAWGNHESYVCWRDLSVAACQLMAHVVTRVPYASAGSLSGNPEASGFELSQRARHMQCAVGGETTRNRAVFCTRIRKESDASERGWKRAHLITKDSQRSPFGIYLTFGVTGLLFLLVNDGHRIGKDLQLEDPVAAIRAVSASLDLRVPLVLQNGRKLTPLEIQRIYLERAQSLIRKGNYPSWTEEVLHHWEDTLHRLETDPMSLATRLDAYRKLSIFEGLVKRSNFSWEDVKRSLQVLRDLRRQFPQMVLSALLNESDELSTELQPMLHQAERIVSQQNVDSDLLRFTVGLQVRELAYHELGGLYDKLEADGHIDRDILDEADIARARAEPPRGSRAEVRGFCVKTLSNQIEQEKDSWRCDWNLLVNQSNGKVIDLRDPFVAKRVDTTLKALESDPSFFYNPVSRLSRLLR